MTPTPNASGERWPDGLGPRECPVYALNEILVRAEPAAIWQHLIAAPRWPQWYPFSSHVRLADNASHLALGMRFDWHTFDLDIHSQVLEWQPNRRIAWNAQAIFTSVYHRWTIEPWHSGLTRITTEETERGLLPWLLQLYLRPRLLRQHETWLQNLKCLSEGFPAASPRAAGGSRRADT